MTDFLLEVLTPHRTLFLGKALKLSARAVDGEVEVLPGHAPYINLLAEGEVSFTDSFSVGLCFNHKSGILEVTPQKVSVLIYQ